MRSPPKLPCFGDNQVILGAPPTSATDCLLIPLSKMAEEIPTGGVMAKHFLQATLNIRPLAFKEHQKMGLRPRPTTREVEQAWKTITLHAHPDKSKNKFMEYLNVQFSGGLPEDLKETMWQEAQRFLHN